MIFLIMQDERKALAALIVFLNVLEEIVRIRYDAIRNVILVIVTPITIALLVHDQGEIRIFVGLFHRTGAKAFAC